MKKSQKWLAAQKTKKPWTFSQLMLLKKEYSTVSNKKLEVKLNHPKSSIRRRAKKMGLCPKEWRKPTITSCANCGKELRIKRVLKMRVKYGNFCSRKCKGEWQTTHLSGRNHPLFQEPMRKKCKICGKEIEIKNWERNRKQFCSRTCRSLYVAAHMLKKDTSIELKVQGFLNEIGINYSKQKVVPKARTVADFYLPKENLMLYCDGDYWHSLPNIKKRNAWQNEKLATLGYEILRLSETEINDGTFIERFNEKIR